MAKSDYECPYCKIRLYINDEEGCHECVECDFFICAGDLETEDES